jgi:SAM-dependent methyltransferase
MLQALCRIPKILLRLGREIADRLVTHGPESAWICFNTHRINFASRLRNRLISSSAVCCPCCGWAGAGFRALDCGRFTVPEAECPHCGCHERHRFLHLFLTRRPPTFMTTPGRILHFAPEQSVRHFIDQNEGAHCLSTDYAKGIYRSILQGVPPPVFVSDIHHMPLAEDCIDGSFCLHVLEHVANDREAIRNVYRTTANGGEAVFMVPFMMDQTETEEYDGPDPELFDHVRGYSPLDFKDRLAPFAYEEITPGSMLTAEEIARYKIPNSQVIYLCRKERGEDTIG